MMARPGVCSRPEDSTYQTTRTAGTSTRDSPATRSIRPARRLSSPAPGERAHPGPRPGRRVHSVGDAPGRAPGGAMQKDLPFSREEYRTRLMNVRQDIAARGLDGLLVHTPENIYYLTG